jgi:beta-lactamase regulating signal transducer with metallopeptidase domain
VTYSSEQKSEVFEQSNMAAKELTKVRILYFILITGVVFGLQILITNLKIYLDAFIKLNYTRKWHDTK